MAYTTIDDPTIYFDTKLWTGTGSEQAISSLGFQPDWVWIKRRDSSKNHRLTDSVRGATKEMYSDLSDAEDTQAQGLKSFDSTGFTLGTNAGYNASSGTYVGWNWKAGGSASSNSNGSITSSVSANTTAGFSIVSYTGNETSGATIGHGLGAVPTMIMAKRRNSGNNWGVYHQGIGNGNALYLDTNSTTVDSNAFWNDTTPTSTVFTLGDSATVNGSSDTYIAYCFADVKGYSKSGSYEGNANADGTFVYTGFLPAWVMVKNIDASENWIIFDNKRPGYNLTDALLKPNLSNAESTSGVKFDLLSNGFKARVSDAEGNSSNTFIYMAFAQSPFVNSNGVPTNAR